MIPLFYYKRIILMIFDSKSLLFVAAETGTNGFRVLSLEMLALISIVSGILVIIIKNPVVSVLYLIGLFFSVAGYLMALGVNYIGLAYLLVYVGAVSILFLFILMLINVRVSELVSETRNSISLALMTVVAFTLLATDIAPQNEFYSLMENGRTNFFSIINYIRFILSFALNKIFFVTSQSWDGNVAEFSNISSLGNIMYSNYAMWLVITSIILLLAMVGTIAITVKPTDYSKSLPYSSRIIESSIFPYNLGVVTLIVGGCVFSCNANDLINGLGLALAGIAIPTFLPDILCSACDYASSLTAFIADPLKDINISSFRNVIVFAQHGESALPGDHLINNLQRDLENALGQLQATYNDLNLVIDQMIQFGNDEFVERPREMWSIVDYVQARDIYLRTGAYRVVLNDFNSQVTAIENTVRILRTIVPGYTEPTQLYDLHNAICDAIDRLQELDDSLVSGHPNHRSFY